MAKKLVFYGLLGILRCAFSVVLYVAVFRGAGQVKIWTIFFDPASLYVASPIEKKICEM